MKKFLILSVAVLGMTMDVSTQNRSINFIDTTLSALKEKAKKENKLIFLVIVLKSCGPCKIMDKKVFTNGKVATFFNTHFICAKIDVEKNKEMMFYADTDGILIFPTFIFLTPNGDIVYKSYGGKNRKELILLGSDALDKVKNP